MHFGITDAFTAGMLTQRQIFEFDDFRVDTGQFLLTKAGHSSPMTPTVFRILVFLLEHPGEVVTKEQLMKQVWPDSFVEEGNLNRNVSTLRKALGERPSDHRYIETIPKTGYRFIASVRKALYQQPSVTLRPADAGALQQLVGRDCERQQLRHAYDLARDGHGGIVAISGDIGMGKTALVDIFLQDLLKDGQNFHLARSRCSESLIEGEPFMPWIEALSGIAKTPAVSETMQTAAPTWYREISHTGSGVARRMKRELLDFCSGLPHANPLIIVIDDFQFSDNGSVDLLAFLATRLEATHTLVIVCYRLVEMKIRNHPFLQARSDLLSRGAYTEIQLSFLKKQDIERHLALQHPEGTFNEDDVNFVQAKTEGNPLFVREVLRHRDDRSEVIHNLVEAKLNRLDDTNRQLLVTASVQGREFDSAVLATSMHMNPQDVEESLNDLHEIHGLIRPIREEQLADGKFTVRYRFVYAFCQEACYVSLAPTRKASLNASLAEAFLTYYGN
jgi:DNA-binding winged helix-turn-helix (wHTH) protein/predicted ATPase